MRLPGYCTSCRRFRYVRVSSHGLAMMTVKKVAEGICDECERQDDRKQRREGGQR